MEIEPSALAPFLFFSCFFFLFFWIISVRAIAQESKYIQILVEQKGSAHLFHISPAQPTADLTMHNKKITLISTVLCGFSDVCNQN